MNRLNIYVLKQFITPLITTFFIVIFVLLMQFVWMFIDDIVGKGLPTLVVLEFFYYAFLRLILQATPLTILLASIMTFGSLGERLELLSMKAAGISLFKIMRPLIILVIFLTLGAFVFINTVEPEATKKLATLRYDISRKNPAMDLKESIFNFDIKGLAIKIDKKNKETGMLYGLKIYNHDSDEGGNSNVTTADSGIIAQDTLANALTLTLYSGTSVRNAKEHGKSYDKEKVPLQRDTFAVQVMIFNNNEDMKRSNTDIYKRLWFAKKLPELKQSTDSLRREYDEEVTSETRSLHRGEYKLGLQLAKDEDFDDLRDSIQLGVIDVDSVFANSSLRKQGRYMESAIAFAKRIQQKSDHRQKQYETRWFNIRKHAAETHKRYTIPLSCLIFFFIGAPLGAIIRKGGFGMPVIISIILFIVWYILDTFGKKMATEGITDIWIGMWMSTIILGIVGIFLTYQAATDSVIMNSDVYMRFFKKIGEFFKRKKLGKQ